MPMQLALELGLRAELFEGFFLRTVKGVLHDLSNGDARGRVEYRVARRTGSENNTAVA